MDDCHSAPGVHLITWKSGLGRGKMKNLDFMGMKYTICGLLALLAALSMTVQSFAQASSYVSSAASVNSLDSTDDPQTGAMLTIHKRVDEVNVLFIATDKHGKF